MIKIKRVFEKPSSADGYRVLVDRLWPRGISKKDAAIDLWLREIAPGNDLRKSFGHDPEKWLDFQRKYKKELDQNESVIQEIKEILRREAVVTLVYAAKDELHNQAIVIRKYLSRFG
jgi:uncharacterized protein YeaO (DUF488 family)